MKKSAQNAFTLAEVLITLVIIGVVAAITIPAVIQKAAKQQYVVKLQKAHNTLKAVVRRSVEDNGPIKYWDTGDDVNNKKPSFEKYFKPYFDIMIDCGCNHTNPNDKCFSSTLTYRDGTPFAAAMSATGFCRIMTSDGISYAYSNETVENVSEKHIRKAYFIVDVNGKKGPNIISRDVFSFHIYTTIGVNPGSSFSTSGVVRTTEQINTACADDSKDHGGGWCAAKVLSEGAMNY